MSAYVLSAFRFSKLISCIVLMHSNSMKGVGETLDNIVLCMR